ncbi:hypothetical protein V6N12_040364 [Hibiscus sabdariffa]|uniref:Uncharacterized protein n=1 Tax=Hibiscus sabdariffa TaxID=183260 RepID=A0ABR2E596_9ROSI
MPSFLFWEGADQVGDFSFAVAYAIPDAFTGLELVNFSETTESETSSFDPSSSACYVLQGAVKKDVQARFM